MERNVAVKAIISENGQISNGGPPHPAELGVKYTYTAYVECKIVGGEIYQDKLVPVSPANGGSLKVSIDKNQTSEGLKTTLSKTDFGNAQKGSLKDVFREVDLSKPGQMGCGSADCNPVEFLLWDNSIKNYTLFMTGVSKVCLEGSEITANITINVNTLDNISISNANCTGAGYNNQTNVVGYFGGCSFTYKNLPTGWNFKTLQVVRKGEFAFTPDGLARETVVFVDDKNPAIQCGGDIDGKCDTMFSFEKPGVFNSTPSFFSPPFLSSSQCDYGALLMVKEYVYAAKVSNYLLGQYQGSVAGEKNWVPIKVLDYLYSLTPLCNIGHYDKKACGTGLGSVANVEEEDKKFSNDWVIIEPQEKKFESLRDVTTPPQWTGIFEEKYPYIALAAYFEGSTGNSWIMCPKSSSDNAHVDQVQAFDEFHDLDVELSSQYSTPLIFDVVV